jgi:hypothetical protein
MWIAVVTGHMALVDPWLIKPAMDAISDGWTLGRAARSIQFVKFETMLDRPLDEVRAEFGLNRQPRVVTPDPERIPILTRLKGVSGGQMKHRMLNASVGLALAGALASTAVARPLQSCAVPARAEVTLGPDKIARIDLLLADMVAKKIAPGAVVRIEQDGRIVYRRTLGMADAEAARPMQADSLFRIFSMTKPVTSVAALQLVARGKLALDAPLPATFPNSPARACGKDPQPRQPKPSRSTDR